jgi:hypothetical protein
MRTSRIHPDERWTRFLEQDIDRLIQGASPDNSDLEPLLPVLDEVRGYSTIDLSDPIVIQCAATASEIVRTQVARSGVDPHSKETDPVPRIRRAVSTIRTRATATLAGFVMLSGLTGVAWASDGAVPGDWNYTIDRALESIGIGAGGVEERQSELEVLQSEEAPVVVVATTVSSANPAANDGPDTESTRTTGLEKAAESVITNGASTSDDIRNGVSTLLLHLLRSGDVVGTDIAQMAKGLGGRPEDHPGKGTPPESPGKSSDAGSRAPNKP